MVRGYFYTCWTCEHAEIVLKTGLSLLVLHNFSNIKNIHIDFRSKEGIFDVFPKIT